MASSDEVISQEGFARCEIHLATERFVIRTLHANDVGPAYAAWFDDPVVQRWIQSRPEPRPQKELIAELRDFVESHDSREDSLLLGVFTPQGQHVANMKYEPIDREARMAVVGVLIGGAQWRSRGLFGEVFEATADLLHRRFDIHSIELGVDEENVAARVAYERSGFGPVVRPEMLPLIWMERRLT